jgi:hypothetical protein
VGDEGFQVQGVCCGHGVQKGLKRILIIIMIIVFSNRILHELKWPVKEMPHGKVDQ